MREAATALLALWNDVDPEVEDAYNVWHAYEHVPQRCSVPGILWGRRYRHRAGAAMPRYLTLYGLSDLQVLDGAPYAKLLREPTPMSRMMRPALRRISRWVCRLQRDTLAPDARSIAVRLLGGDAAAAQAAADRLAAGSGRSGVLVGERMLQASPLPWLAADQDQGLAGGWLVCVEPGDGAEADDTARYDALPVG